MQDLNRLLSLDVKVLEDIFGDSNEPVIFTMDNGGIYVRKYVKNPEWPQIHQKPLYNSALFYALFNEQIKI